MEIQSLEVYSSESNYAIIKPPGRHFPGCVIQGDSLSILCRKVQGIAEAAKRGDMQNPDFLDDVKDLNNALIGRIIHYQQVLAQHGIALPFGRPFTGADLFPVTLEDETVE